MRYILSVLPELYVKIIHVFPLATEIDLEVCGSGRVSTDTLIAEEPEDELGYEEESAGLSCLLDAGKISHSVTLKMEDSSIKKTHRPTRCRLADPSGTPGTPERKKSSIQGLTAIEEVLEKLKAEPTPGDCLYSVATYCSEDTENKDILHLVEGERVYILESHNSDWWFVKKHLTEETGWVPASYLKDEISYTHFVQKRLDEKIAKLPVFEKPHGEMKSPRFIEKLQPISAQDGSTTQFECIIEGTPRPVITWFRQTAIIKPSSDFQIFYDEDNVCTLIIREVFPEDAGLFTIVAKNAAGFASSSAQLVVEAPLSDHGSEGTYSRRSISRESSVCELLDGIPPTFAARPRTAIVDEGATVELECRLVAVPEPEISWSFNDKALEETDRITWKKISDVHMYHHVVRISEVTKEDTGTYKIFAKNREGVAETFISLRVESREPPEIVMPLKDVEVTEDESATLRCKIRGVPQPRVTWSRGGEDLKTTDQLRISRENDVYICKILKTTLSDVGEYYIKATNQYGTVKTEGKLAVKERTLVEPPIFMDVYKETIATEGATLSLSASVDGTLPMALFWTRNGKKLKPSDTIRIDFDDTTNTSTLEVDKLTVDRDTGEYAVTASNVAGKAHHKATVHVKPATPQPPKEPPSLPTSPVIIH